MTEVYSLPTEPYHDSLWFDNRTGFAKQVSGGYVLCLQSSSRSLAVW